jgi:ribosomal protein S18 acetylase RimI-like enzyme
MTGEFDTPGHEVRLEKGFLKYRFAPGRTVEIVDIEVDPLVRGNGWGRRLLEILFKRLDDSVVTVYAITRTENEVAIQFYESCRFEVLGVLRRFYGGKGVNAIMYGRSPRGPV